MLPFLAIWLISFDLEEIVLGHFLYLILHCSLHSLL